MMEVYKTLMEEVNLWKIIVNNASQCQKYINKRFPRFTWCFPHHSRNLEQGIMVSKISDILQRVLFVYFTRRAIVG